MLDPFRNIVGDKPRAFQISPSLHIGVVKSYNSSTKTCMVSVPTINDSEALGPFRIVKSFSSSSFVAPVVGQIVALGCIDGNFSDMVILGYLA